jgi:hypothetical protein
MPDKNRILLILSLSLVLVAGVTHTAHINGAGLASEDDIRFALRARVIRAGGWDAYWDEATTLASRQGRFYFLFSTGFFVAPYMLPDGLVRAGFITSIQFAALGALVLFLRRHLSGRACLWLFGLLCALIPIWGRFNPVTATPVYYHIPTVLFFGALVLRARTRSRGPIVRHAYVAPLFLSLMFYEILLLPFLLIAILDELAARRAEGSRDGLAGGVRAALPVLLTFGTWMVAYVIYRHLHPSVYDGSRIAPLSVMGTVRGVVAFILSGVPGMNLATHYEMLPEVIHGYLPVMGLPAILLAHLTAAGWAQAILAMALGAAYVLTATGPQGTKRQWPGAAWPALVCLAVAFALPLPLMITVKYRDTAAAWAPYIPGYYIFLALLAAFALLLEPSLSLLGGGRRMARGAAAAALGLISFGAVAATFIANDVISAASARPARKWKLVDTLLRTSALDRLPQGSAILAPALWEDFPNVHWIPYEEYWTQYIELHSGRRVRVVQTPDASRLTGDATAPLFYFEPVSSTCAGEGLMLSRVVRGRAGAAGLLTDHSIVVSQNAPNACVMEGIAGEAEGAAAPGDPRVQVQVPRAEVQNGIFVAEFRTPAMLAGSGNLIRQTARPAALEVVFARGFSGKERDSRNFWIWNDGASGEGEINLQNNTGGALPVKLRFTVMTGQADKARFDVEGPGLRESYMLANAEPAEWLFQLEPGSNRVLIKSHARRVNAPGDPRHLVFGMQNYVLSAGDSPPRKRIGHSGAASQ